MTIAVYYRCSTDRQDLGHQRHAVREWMTGKGYDLASVTEYVDEAVSGSLGASHRPGFAALEADMRQGKIKKVVLFEMSRASRDFMTFLGFMELAASNHCEVEVVGSGVQGFSTSTDKLMASVQAFVAQAERERISERTKSGLAKAKASGVKLGAPKGHKRNLGRRKAHNPQLVAEVQKYTAKGLSCADIAAILGTRFTPKPISHVTVWNIRKRYAA